MGPLHQDCEEAKKLRKSYIKALASFDSVKIATKTGISAQDAEMAQERLRNVRIEVLAACPKNHHCRKR